LARRDHYLHSYLDFFEQINYLSSLACPKRGASTPPQESKAGLFDIVNDDQGLARADHP
jgi:hypothetical protein